MLCGCVVDLLCGRGVQLVNRTKQDVPKLPLTLIFWLQQHQKESDIVV